jgi:PRC-barrel domain
MPTVERIETWRGQDVLDNTGEKAGHLGDVYYDADAQDPVLISIKSGVLRVQVTLVPAAEVVVSRDYLRVPYSAEQIHRAESGRADEELSSEQVAAVGAMFELTLPSSGPLYSASLIERRRIEAEKADRRAHELELEATKRAEDEEAARKRAGAAAEKAQEADRERERADEAANLSRP